MGHLLVRFCESCAGSCQQFLGHNRLCWESKNADRVDYFSIEATVGPLEGEGRVDTGHGKDNTSSAVVCTGRLCAPALLLLRRFATNIANDRRERAA
jgi:hypothetical protein